MAQQILVCGVSKVLELSITKAIEEYKLTRDVKEEILKLQDLVVDITGLVQDAESKQLNDRESAGRIRGWLRRLKDASYEAIDVFDDYSTEILRREVERDHGREEAGTSRAPALNKVRKLLSCCIASFEEVSFRNKEAHAVRDIKEKLNEIVNQGTTLGLTKIVRECPILPAQNMDTARETGYMEVGPVFGRDEDTEKIINLLIGNEYSDMDPSIVPIFGVGGLGKTTLARKVFNDPRVSVHFPEIWKRWVYVGESFDANKIMANILKSDNNKSLAFPDLQGDLAAKLKDCRYFIVLDDVWNENHDEWEKLWTALARGGKGSKVLVTTRSQKVTQVMGIFPDPTPLGFLNEDDCWSILKKVAFCRGVSPDKLPKLEQIGWRIVKQKLRGLPLEAKTIGGLLSYRLEEDAWNEILESEIWRMEQDRNGILPALKLSYWHLPPEVRQCFAYCSVFERGYEFDEAEIVKFWMGQGFILTQGSESPEDRGRQYFRELLLISFFQFPRKYPVNRHETTDSYVMHDRVWDLARLMSEDECIHLKDNEELNVPKNTCVRHLSWHLHCDSSNISANLEKLYKFDRLRTLLIRLYIPLNKRVHLDLELFRKLKCLRVLHITSWVALDIVVPDSIGELKHLRYLYVSPTLELPETTSKLYNLQTLTLPTIEEEECYFQLWVPSLINLRHLEAPPCVIDKMPGIGKLQHLQKLDRFVVRKEKGHGIEELEAMNELRGRLSILNLQNVESQAMAAKTNLKEKVHLRKLEFIWADSGQDSYSDFDSADDEELVEEPGDSEQSSDFDDDSADHLGGNGAFDEEVLESLQPPPKLEKLSIICYGGVGSPSWMTIQSLTNLQVLRLVKCMRWEVLPPLEQLCSLRSLELTQMHQLESMPQAVPRSLRRLVVHDCPKLKAFPPVPPELTEMVIWKVGLLEALPELQGYGGGDQMTAQSSSRGSLSLEISDCPNLKSLRTGLLLRHDLRALEKLVISNCNGKDVVQLLQNLSTSLSSLKISNCQSLTSLTEEALCHLTALKNLEIRDCEELMLLGFQSLISLQELTIENCPKLMAPTANAAPSSSTMPPPPLPLRRIYLDDTTTNFFLSPPLLRYFTSVEKLIIENCPQLVSFTAEEEEAWKSLSSLEILHISDCSNLRSLPTEMHSLTSLKSLCIYDCPQIQSFPERGLPSSLKLLRLFGCPPLEAQRERQRDIYPPGLIPPWKCVEKMRGL